MSDEIMLVFGEDGVAREYDDTWDITIHCESEEEQKVVLEKLNNSNQEAQELSNNSPKPDKENGDLQPTCNQLATDAISRTEAMNAVSNWLYDTQTTETSDEVLLKLPSARPEEVIPHRNYKYLSDYWCECGWHLGKKGEVKYCSECGRKVNWDG